MIATPALRDTPGGELAAWTHMWMVAASLTLEHLEDSWVDAEPASSIGGRDALSLVVIDAVRNVYRGAKATLPRDSPALARFDGAHPQLVRIRDFFEHFDEYVAGRGRIQQKAGTPADEGIGMQWKRSASGGPSGHTMVIAVREGGERAEYEVNATLAVKAAQMLARAVLEHAGLLDARHVGACRYCR
ncbi:hypothetical protein [Actinotalea sp. Marseille-Q4924]|uniref:hypothetical protein n=1 Tax=Actinotalea sp. Marseille-Q4924 TaxID=2866571 RepID=UPI001CE447F1|nr:hypothetical protein [Actinotalea sp. Marseille-Q4924]